MANRKAPKTNVRRATRNGGTDIINWPTPNQTVTFSHALMAIAFGNAPILARYLAETTPVSSQITKLVAKMLDPTGSFSRSKTGCGDDNFWGGSWRLEFKRIGSGNRKNHSEKSMSLLQIGLFILDLKRHGETTKEAVYKAEETFGIHRATALEALHQAKVFFDFNPPKPEKVLLANGDVMLIAENEELLAEIEEFCQAEIESP